jgi:hypothetical protein
VDRAVELAVAATVQPVALGVARARRDRGGASVPREARVGREALCAGGVADDDRGGDRPAAVLGQQCRAVSFDQRFDFGAQLAPLDGDLSDPLQDQFRDANLRAAWQTCEPAGDSLADLRVVKARWGELGFKLRRELHEVPTQPVRQAAAFGHDLVAVVVEDADLERLLVQVRDRERFGPFSERGAGDRGRVDRIGLPRLAYCPPGCLGQPRRDADDSVTAGEKPALQPAGHVSAVLYRPHALGVELCGERQRQQRAVVRRRDRQLPARDAGYRIERDKRVRALVCVHTDHDHLHRPFVGENRPTERISGGHTSVGAMPRSYEVTPKVLGWRRARRLKPVRPNRPTGVKRVSPPPSESQTDEPDDTDRRPSGSH